MGPKPGLDEVANLLLRESKVNFFLVVQPLAWSLLYNGCYSNFTDRSVHRGTLTRPAVMLNRVPRSSSDSVSVNVKVLLICCTLNIKLLFFGSLNI